ncbi:aminodeoxychorismate synthase component I [Sphingobium fontiphilum]|nr:aminodeoxychorismate synthase component I [Sphingobium fontiphilum]
MPYGDGTLHHRRAPFLLFDDARPVGAAPARLYRDPVGMIVARLPQEVAPALERLAEAVRAGRHAAGYCAYELGFALEPRLEGLASAPTDGDMPLLWFGLFESVELAAASAVPAMLPDAAAAKVNAMTPMVSRADYLTAFGRVQDMIRAGDIYQANLTFPCELAISGDPLALYAAIRGRQQAPHGGIVSTGQGMLLSFSPELFFALGGGRLAARPMKGTATRRADRQEDAAAMAALAADPKQRAENLMIVDLLRNDLSRVSVAGSVKVPDLFRVETYPTVHQMVSDVQSVLRPGLGPVDVLRALFPCGSITGAPKLRAMEVIAAVEPHGRGAYTGAMGWIDPEGDASFNVLIRTLAIGADPTRARIGLGSGVIADSTGPEEWAECLAKARFLTDGWRSEG